MMVLWLLILRGIGIEFRARLDAPVWTGIVRNGAFGIASLMLTIFYRRCTRQRHSRRPISAPMVISSCRCGPIGKSAPLRAFWIGIASIGGLVALVALALHGAHYAALKTTGDLNRRCGRATEVLWPVLVFDDRRESRGDAYSFAPRCSTTTAE